MIGPKKLPKRETGFGPNFVPDMGQLLPHRAQLQPHSQNSASPLHESDENFPNLADLKSEADRTPEAGTGTPLDERLAGHIHND